MRGMAWSFRIFALLVTICHIQIARSASAQFAVPLEFRQKGSKIFQTARLGVMEAMQVGPNPIPQSGTLV